MINKTIPVSTIAQQWYCEKQVDLSIKYPGIQESSPFTESGKIGHAELESQSKSYTDEEVEEHVSKGKPISIAERPLSTTYKTWTIMGKPDYVEFRGKKAKLLIEFKFSRTGRIFDSYIIQLNMYGFLLDRNGFDTSELYCAAVCFPVQDTSDKQLDIYQMEFSGMKKKVVQRCKKLIRKKENKISEKNDEFTLLLYKFPIGLAISKLDWALQYWTKQRKPIPTKYEKKCSLCQYNAFQLCNQSLTEVDHNRITARKRRTKNGVRYYITRKS